MARGGEKGRGGGEKRGGGKLSRGKKWISRGGEGRGEDIEREDKEVEKVVVVGNE